MLKVLINQVLYEYEDGIKVGDIIAEQDNSNDIYAVVYNGKLADYDVTLQEDGELSFVYKDDKIGKQIYQRTLLFLFIAAVQTYAKGARVNVHHSLANGHYCEIKHLGAYLTPADVDDIKAIMETMVKAAISIKKETMNTRDLADYFASKGEYERSALLHTRTSQTSNLYRLGEAEGYFYGHMLPNTSYLTHFSLRYYAPGIWISPYEWHHDQPKLFRVFEEFEHWGTLIGVSNVAQLNMRIEQGDMNDLVLMSETMIEKKLSELTNMIVKDHEQTRFILIAGPSSVGKTTFSKRLSIHLKIHGKQPFAISMDDFYKNRKDCVLLENGSYDFESLHALDLDLFHKTMLQLMQHEPVQLPHFNFKTGKREWLNNVITLQEDDVVIIEGIHGLNPQVSYCLPNAMVFKIYINALTHLNLDDDNPIPTSDYRLIRRIVRDYQFRGWNACDTIRFWSNVQAGEESNIYPYQEEADYIFNSSMVYEMAILKKLIMPLLMDVKNDQPEFQEANRLRSLLSYFTEGDAQAVPRSSILAEFIGNSIFDV